MCSYCTEYERKFAYSSATEVKLIELGAKMIKQQVLKDIYFDTADYHFVLHDHWLRRRNESWELKYRPSSSCKTEQFDNIAKYREMTDENAIKEVLFILLHSISETELATTIRISNLTNMVTSAHLKILAQFQSSRKKYSIENLTIDLDETDFGLRVGEIECLVCGDGTEDEAVTTTERINKMASVLGISNEKMSGKMETYLTMNNPKLFEKLTTLGILSNMS